MSFFSTDFYRPPGFFKKKWVHGVPLPASGRICGIYFLLRDGEVVYVGQSVATPIRVWTHLSEAGKDFDSAFFIEVPPSELTETENAFIAYFDPEYNRRPGMTQPLPGRLARHLQILCYYMLGVSLQKRDWRKKTVRGVAESVVQICETLSDCSGYYAHESTQVLRAVGLDNRVPA
jgi:hypothetical protein